MNLPGARIGPAIIVLSLSKKGHYLFGANFRYLSMSLDIGFVLCIVHFTISSMFVAVEML